MMLRDTILLTTDEFDSLPEYSSSLPTGTTIGKRWICKNDYDNESKGWVMGEYVDHPDPSKVGILWRDIKIRDLTSIESVS